MSEDSFTEVTEESWFSRIGGAIKGILVGFILFVAAFPLLFWNEGRSVKRYKTLKEGGGAVISVTSDGVNQSNAGKLIHVNGLADTNETLQDPVFGVSVKALKLKRVVEMYQWKESSKSQSQKKLGGGEETVTTYTYSKEWSDRAISSGNFKKPSGHQNPGALPYESIQKIAGKVTFGSFTLSPSLIGMINTYETLTLGSSTVIPAALQDRAELYGSGFYIGPNPASPQVGDIQVKFKIVKPVKVSVIAKQSGNSFEPYHTKSGGGSIELLQSGVHSADAMIKQAQESNKMMAWILRLVGFILMLVGLNMMFKLLSVLADVLPILGDIVGVGTGIISFLIAGTLSLLTIAIAWIFYRPLLGILLIVAAGGLTAAVIWKLKGAKATA